MATHSVLLPAESQGQRSLLGYSPPGHIELGRTKATEHTHITCLMLSLKVTHAELSHLYLMEPPELHIYLLT